MIGSRYQDNFEIKDQIIKYRMEQVADRKLKRGASTKDKSMIRVGASKENKENLQHEDTFKLDYIKYRSNKFEQILKQNLSQYDKMEDQISGFFKSVDLDVLAVEEPLKSLSAESSNIAIQFDDPMELFAHIQNMAQRGEEIDGSSDYDSESLGSDS